jgi:hypothetical protein
MAKKAYIRFDNKGKAVPSTLIWSENKPKIGDWKEIDGYKCCIPTTTTTTSSSTTTTTTTIAPNIINLYEASCAPYYWELADITLDSSGVFEYTSGNDTYVLNFTNTIPLGSFYVLYMTAINSYTAINGNVYTASGDYTILLGGTGDCPSTEYVLHLTIIEEISACGSYTWPINDETYTETGTYTSGDHTLILTINLTYSEISVIACNSYRWNGNLYTTSGDYTVFVTNPTTGCTMEAVLHLTINPC